MEYIFIHDDGYLKKGKDITNEDFELCAADRMRIINPEDLTVYENGDWYPIEQKHY